MAQVLDPAGSAVRVGNIILFTPGLAGVAEVHAPGTPGMRAAESSTAELDAALVAEEMVPVQTVELTQTREVDAGGGSLRGSPAGKPPIRVTMPAPADGWGQLLLATDESGVMTWNFAPPAAVLPSLRQQGLRTYEVRRHVPVSEPREATTRGLTGAIGKKILKVVAFKLLDKVAGEVSDHFVGKWEAKKRPYNVRLLTPDDYTAPDVAPLNGDGWARLQSGRALLFVHGTFSRTNTAFGRLPAEVVAELGHHYDGRVFAFDHFTLSHDPRENVDLLLQRIPDGTKLELDIVCHSRGGLVSRILAEKQRDISLGSRRLAIRKIAFVGTPNAGTILADPRHFGSLVDTYTNLLNFFPDTGVIEVLQTVIAVVKQLAVGAIGGLAGLTSMVPGGRFLTDLNGVCDGAAEYFALASDYTPPSAGLRDWVTDRLVDSIFSQAGNDLVVPSNGVSNANGGSLFPIQRRALLRGAESVGHSRYFASELAQQNLREWLLHS